MCSSVHIWKLLKMWKKLFLPHQIHIFSASQQFSEECIGTPQQNENAQKLKQPMPPHTFSGFSIKKPFESL